MSINFTTKSVKLTGALKAFTLENLSSIEKISGEIIDAEVIILEEKLKFKVEMNVKTKLHSYHIEDNDPILKQAIRKTLNTLKSKAKKNKDKLKGKRANKNGTGNKFAEPIIPAVEPVEAAEAPASRDITISTNFAREPLSVEEAVFYLKDSGDNAYMFTNVETDKMSVVYIDKDKNISIIEAM